MENKRNFWDVILEDENISSMNFLIRWNKGVPSFALSKDTLSNHSYWVTLFSGIIVGKLLDKVEFAESSTDTCMAILHKFRGDTLMYACLHDFDEPITGDILHDVKYNESMGQEVRGLLDKFIKLKMTDYTDRLLTNTEAFEQGSFNYFSDLLKRYFVDSFKGDFGVVKSVVKMGDCLSSIFVLQKELEMGNIHPVIQTLYDHYINYLKRMIPIFSTEYQDFLAKYGMANDSVIQNNLTEVFMELNKFVDNKLD